MVDSAVDHDDLLGTAPFVDYNADERLYSVYVRDTLLQLLKGERDELDLLARYHQDPNRLGVLPPPKTTNSAALRLSKLEEILSETIRFLHDGSEGGPVAQSEEDGRDIVVQRRDFPTRFPHIVIQRTDIYDTAKREFVESSWCVRRLQNQRRNVRLNRVLDALNLGVELIKWARE